MGLLNENVAYRLDDDTPISNTFIRITDFNSKDYSNSPSDLICQFSFYASEEKWNTDRLKNRILIKGITDYSFKIPYSREENGVDIALYAYSYLIGLLATKLQWDPNLIMPTISTE